MCFYSAQVMLAAGQSGVSGSPPLCPEWGWVWAVWGQMLQCHCPAQLQGMGEGYRDLGESCCFLLLPVPTPFQPVLHPKVTSPGHDQFLSHPTIYKSSKPGVLFGNSYKDSGRAEILAVAGMWGRGRQRGEELSSSTELPGWDLQGKTSRSLRLGAKPKGIDAVP